MTRIIGGAARGRSLRVPERGTRPTSDRVRESVFSSLEHRLGAWHGLVVFDLYAGSGALALEALSRGASRAVAVESDRRAVQVLRANAAMTGLAPEIVQADVARFVRQRPATPPDVVFADPPYDVPAETLRANLAALLAQIQGHEVLLVIERSARDTASAVPEGCTEVEVRTVGETAITYAHWYGVPHE